MADFNFYHILSILIGVIIAIILPTYVLKIIFFISAFVLIAFWFDQTKQ
jgi:hypothetical protein